MQYRTKDGDMLDAICFTHYGHTNGTTEAVLEANPGLSEYGPLLPAGILITLPTLETPAKQDTISLWD